ncbi:hypothetical protein MS2017_0552 [Bathymodiolus thermophilus thioautotrophic gill symbiont]|uniref:ADP ribosyltransferase domain-containing protein n=1 Tax=Bathymodiolus thermophilus thioautotrophic gill symbiont TaxID=2360 RepID=A0A3G3IKL8_9GAMM|nr:ADP-ribosyltransferase [Bathymodiolus thermophilus thioautotrophic gill symbiont]AYQ56291.1 hypothetical protein MS2017_0552 [Bathymodiolus thermophilus thioautotrophic gill symbiont]
MKKYYLLITLLTLTVTNAFATVFPDVDKQRHLFANNDRATRSEAKLVHAEKMYAQTEELELTKAESDYFAEYTTDSNDFVNDYLGDGLAESDPLTVGNYQTRIKKFSETLEKFPPSNSNIYRGSSSTRSSGNGKPYYNLDAENPPQVVEGDYLVTNKFTSFSSSFEEASYFSRTGAEGDIGVIFGIENSASSAPIALYSHEDEAEALVKPGQAYKIKKITSYDGFIDDMGHEKKMVTVELGEEEMIPSDANVFFMTQARPLNQEEFRTLESRLGPENKYLMPDSLKDNINVGLGTCAPET